LDHAEAGRILAERWQLPAEMAAIAGRHHDPTEGLELSLLRVVRVACRLADALGYEVVKPLHPLSVEEVIAELPEHARKRINSDPVQFRQRIERLIAQFGSQEAAPPEETLALLSASSEEADAEPEAARVEQVPAKEGSESQTVGVTKKHWAIAVTVILAAGLIAAFVFWQMR
jgi:hypothetical protein